MKPVSAVALLALSALLLASPALAGAGVAKNDRAITQVVKLLQDMLGKSKDDGDKERVLYAKYKCFCDTTEASKTAEIDSLTKNIGLLESGIAGLQASNGVLSKEVAQLKADMAANKQARDQAEAIRTKEKADFGALEADLTGAISQMTLALQTLSEIGADQTLSVGADHEKFMAKYPGPQLVRLRESVKQALVAASAFVEKKQLKAFQSLVQGPFTATYTAQAGEVVGILKNMLDTFKDNLAAATAREKAAQEAYDHYMAVALQEYATMDEAYNSKQAQLGANDNDLASKKVLLATAQTQKAEAESFLAQLVADCAEKAKQYDRRNALRQNEQAAIAEAISILNSDSAFATFGTVASTRSGPTSLLQRSAIRRHNQASVDQQSRRQQAQQLLWKAAGGKPRFTPLARVAALLEADNPFAVVLSEIDKMVALIDEEGKADEAKLTWCTHERTTSEANIEAKTNALNQLSAEIEELVQAIENPETGLKATIAASELALQNNLDTQTSLTKERRESTAVYQATVENLVEAEALLTKAVAVLQKFYSEVLSSEATLLQQKKQRKEAPETWEGAFKGQSEHGGNDAISMIEFILSNTKKEEETAHDGELAAQHAFEDAIAGLKSEQETLLTSLAEQKMTLAQRETELLGKQKDHKTTAADKAAIEAYLLSIKPGCDIITLNIEERRTDRDTEKNALQSAKGLLQDSPAYKAAMAAAHDESLGECLSICTGKEEHVECKACLAHVTVPGYCAGHPGTEGC